MQLEFGKHTYLLLNEKALYRACDKTLILADLHLGKAQHFRKHGIYLPQQSAERDYERLTDLIQALEPQRMILLGDLFHSSMNHEWIMFCDIVNTYKYIEFVLVLGNHDILREDQYKSISLKIEKDVFEEDEIIFTHHPLEKVPSNKFLIAGHIHPGVVLYGKGKQSVKLPCFYLYKNQLILPAFGSLTGLHVIKPAKGSRVFGVLTNIVMEV